MPNQQNFNSSLTSAASSSVRFLPSRVINTPNEFNLLETVNSAFGSSEKDYIELHLYTIPSNGLVLSTIITPSDNVVGIHTVRYSDGTTKNFLKIDFTKLFEQKRLVIVPGDYNVVMNFFTEEVGNYINRPLKIDNISSDRTEIEISFVNETTSTVESNRAIIKEFVQPYFVKRDMISFTNEVFGIASTRLFAQQAISGDTVIRNPHIVSTYDPNFSDLIEEERELIRTLDRLTRRGQRTNVQNAINSQFTSLVNKIIEQINTTGDKRIQRDEYEAFVREAVRVSIGSIRSALVSKGLIIT